MTKTVDPKFETVMIIDDNSVDLYITSRMISKNNFGKHLLLFTSGEEALKYLLEHQHNTSLLPQVIFVDIYMPLMSGFEFLDAFDKLDDTLKNHIKTYVISSTIDNADIIRSSRNENVSAFHVKPITKEFLDQII
ncbi:response regulator [Flavobacterium sp. 1355]|jgi:CheY-like chemotaxis protein|uniref:response regulator n=1 Tax=Flavobacterium sp. 1355 TaxID=2806571 RepID=UPI001AE1CA0E|nr:response regulator [Flavobacterium sp. 1355]MBP1225693.1 CheY-like chemotaxis protein [Flavobacterium sp. 1355]